MTSTVTLMMALVFTLVMALVAHSQAQGLLAQEEQKPVPTIYLGPVGPYRMIVQAIPNPPTQGLLNLHASVKDPNTGTDVDDASIVVFAQRHESSERGRARFFTSPEYPASYSTQLNLLEEGTWTFTFEVSGPLGKGSAEVVLLVTEQPRSLAGWLAWAGMSAALLLVLFLAWRNANRMRAARGR